MYNYRWTCRIRTSPTRTIEDSGIGRHIGSDVRRESLRTDAVKFPQVAGEAERGRSGELGNLRRYFWTPAMKSGVRNFGNNKKSRWEIG
ncbi:hypothetical protein HBI56_176400 [Parastagonospora nodorum]|uniref:Uncharacterized protein n=1 Tax=Phaeosphaeria nodorum (strain SN15 / ATCC MYA-4574 / FGSC 10173) TaxID=321614 RepID=A0A7U2FEM6_PHANO|nr:hypothetical protein HBH56_237540 [Parastagonospora nodorum]QRD03857.1 hypothetical protein JI435_137240 [Parastagonospora nodorum SN15]KAH3924384.1 hypothetical protein HBH54_197760 [Parastagonospora nodorum]KAH3942553.1 hypothetical protein HBH53_185730 [Parastagonospora nodorum]KAH3961689.1 hypothetical protein HBH51_180970 [Parastagonospora nodorum]